MTLIPVRRVPQWQHFHTLESRTSIQISESQGSQSQPVRVESSEHATSPISRLFGGKREYFVAIAYEATMKTTKKQTKKRTKSVHMDGQTAVWDQRLDVFFVQPPSHIILRLYAKRLTQVDILIGTHEITITHRIRNCGSVGSVASSPDGQRFVSGSEDQTIRVWNTTTTTGDMVTGPFTRHMHPVCSVAFSPDGQRIVSGSYHGAIRMWNAMTGDMMSDPLSGHIHSVTSVGSSESSDGQRFDKRRWVDMQ